MSNCQTSSPAAFATVVEAHSRGIPVSAAPFPKV
jgi:hypothetical protein